MRQNAVDLNGDVGEGVAQEEALIPFLTSVNIACGGHAGDERSMTEAVRRGLNAGAAIGAHPSYPDREQFGRREMAATPSLVQGWLEEQIGQLRSVAERAGVRLRHVKPHGALYNAAARDRLLAEAIVEAVAGIDKALLLVALAGGELAAAGWRGGLRVAAEGFVDRAYLTDGRLAMRGTPGALIENEETAIEQALRLARGESISTLDGGLVCPRVDTLCIHGDGPNAVVFARRLRVRLKEEGIEVRAL